MDVSAFLKTIYLGDRACKAITLDGWNRSIKLEIDCISRIRSPSGNWDYYTDEDIRNGSLVFRGVRNVLLDNAGFLPNDEIDIEVVGEEDSLTVVQVSMASVDERTEAHRIVLRFACESMHLEDPTRQGLVIQI